MGVILDFASADEKYPTPSTEGHSKGFDSPEERPLSDRSHQSVVLAPPEFPVDKLHPPAIAPPIIAKNLFIAPPKCPPRPR